MPDTPTDFEQPVRRPARREQRPISEWSGFSTWDGSSASIPEGYIWSHDEANEDRDVLINHADWIERQELEMVPYERLFGDGTLTTFELSHPKKDVSNVVIIDIADNLPKAVKVDWLTTPGTVRVGPFQIPPAVNRYKLIVEGK